MAEKLLGKDPPASATMPVSVDTQGGAPSINAPQIEPDVKKIHSERRSINSLDQIYRICEAMFDPGSERNVRNGMIADQYNDPPPFTKDEHKRKGQKFRHNFPTGFLSGILDQTINSPIDLIDAAPALTSAALDKDDDPLGEKTEAYRREITKVIRGWVGWRTHIYNLSQEDVVFGYEAVVCDDPDDWRPEECRQDDFGVPDNCGQHASEAQFFGRKKSFMVHKLIEKIVDREAADAAGWYIDNCIAALNEAMPEDRTQQAGTQASSSRTFVDLVRDGNSGAAHDPKARTIEAYILLATEHDGKVSKFIVTQGQQKRILYESYDEFEKLSDIVSFYSLTPGSGTLYSSKGGGRKLINIAKSQERLRNRMGDMGYLGTIMWMHSEKGMVAVQMKVFDQFGVIGSEAEIQPEAFPVNLDLLGALEERFTAWAEQAWGAFIPQKISEDPEKGGARTATEVTEESRRENITRAGWLKRFLGQFKDEITIICRRICDPANEDPKAKEFRELMEKEHGVNKDLLRKLSDQSAGDLVQDMTAQLTAALVQAMPMLKQSPFVDQYKLEKEFFTRLLGKDLIDSIFFDKGADPNDEARELRTQILENAAIRSGESPPAALSDNHLVHSRWIVGDLKRAEPMVQKKVQDGTIEPAVLDNIQTAIKHGEGHVGYGKAIAESNKNQEQAQEWERHQAFYADAQARLDEALKHLMQQKAAQAQPGQPGQIPSGVRGAPALPPGRPGQPGQPAQPEAPEERTWGGMTEKVLVSWIGQFDKLSPDIQAQLEAISGLKPERNPAAPASAERNGESEELTPVETGPTPV